MNWWTIVIYGAAAVIALQGLMAILTVHRRTALKTIFEEELARREAAHAIPEPANDSPSQQSKAA